MKTIKNYNLRKDLYSLSKEKFFEKYEQITEELYENLKKAKQGTISITKIKPNKAYIITGETCFFGEGLSVWIENADEYYYTSIIQNIDYKKGVFHTLNSEYKFTFTEYNDSNTKKRRVRTKSK